MSKHRPGDWNRELLRRVFLHQNGLAALTALATLDTSGALTRLRHGRVRAAELLSDTRSPCAVAASIVAAGGAGWLRIEDGEDDGSMVTFTVPGDVAFAIDVFLDTHRAVRERDRGGRWSDDSAVARLLECVDVVARAKAAIRGRTSMPEAMADLAVRLVEGVVAAPLLPRIATGYDHATIAPVFAALELGDGEAAARRVLSFFAPMYGLAGSYAEALIRLPDRIAAGEAVPPADVTRAIDRSLNVRASATAHRGYFHAANGLVARLFDDTPLSEQPKAVLDVGCGDGTWLRELYEAVRGSTARGRSLVEHPLYLLGVDLDPVALEISRRNLADLPATCVSGDIGDPAAIAAAITSATGINADDILCVRAFVDHNRSLADVEPAVPERLSLAEGVYATPTGSVVCAADVQDDWAAHYERWSRVCRRHGLVVIEAHTLGLDEVHDRMETSHSLALQYYHALSGQSPVSYTSFRGATTSAGLAARHHRLYPAGSPTTSISWLVSAA
jgi:SAM-dependent methyltransferase